MTPSHLIYGKRLISAINNEYIDDATLDISSEQCSNCVKYIKKLLHHYWSRFRKEYLQGLSEQQRYNQRKFKTNESLLIDDVVIIKDENYTPRNQWRQGQIINLVTASDNLIRGASIECVINGKKSIIQRPIEKLIPLEITKRNTEVLPSVNNNFNESSLNKSLPNVNEHKDVQRPKRTAAANANAKIKLINEDDVICYAIDYFVVGSVKNYAYNYFAMIGHS